MKLKFVNKLPKNETIQCNHKWRRHRPNHINSDHWRNKRWSICKWCWIAYQIACRIALGRTGIFVSLATAIIQNSFKILTVKQEKHDAIKLLAQSKIDSITNIISKAKLDGGISPTEFHKVLQEVEQYGKLKADIRNQAKAKVKGITKEQREEILEQGRKEGKEDFLLNNANT